MLHDIVETTRLRIRPYREDDSNALLQILGDPTTMAFWPAPFTEHETQIWIHRSIHSYQEHGFGRWAVILKEEDRLIGDVGILKSVIDGNVEHDLGYIIDAKYWRQGYAVEAARSCMNYGIQELGLTRLCANMPYHHHGSIRTAERLGMRREKEFHNPRNREMLTYLYSIQV
ncbi:GNAT family N-acetyltransferase [Paenibacillus selenitireducens]|uniref:GNAT family N-acetyltransferase n=1 Tax=Paenibacillus selenitireducens TaxID=1324314 RepID=A0A1T2X2C4_9BACL|nr:GNAT family N-acetyltransferase [Paenibacillus selenitireducens]OPA73723.1 GNAT family N-acetyltransferase [Paenibacillus selenitireducens]